MSEQNEQSDRIAVLILKQLFEVANEAEKAALEKWKNESPEHAAYLEEAFREGYLAKGLNALDAAQKRTDQRLRELGAPLLFPDPAEAPPVARVALFTTRWLRYAAVILLVVGAGVYWYTERYKNHQAAYSKNNSLQTDLPPGSNRAVVQLTNGHTIELDSTAKGLIARQGSVTVMNSKGKLDYINSPNQPSLPGYNTITTPKAGQYQLVLSDGTRVWLNAASSLVYPVVFAGNQRSVTLQGEGYFEVAHLSLHGGQRVSFQVKINDSTRVEVLGTHFNIHAYAEEGLIKTTLLEGRVKMQSVLLRPGQQALLTPDRHIHTAFVDTAGAVAWKNGFFHFDGADIPTIMREIARWYDVEIIYKGSQSGRSYHYQGDVPQHLPLSQILKVLETIGVHCSVEGKKIIVRS